MTSIGSRGPTDVELEQRRAQIRRGLGRANTAAVVILIVVIGLAVGAVSQAFRASHSAQEAESSRQIAEKELEATRRTEARALTEQARAQRRTGEAGQRFESLAAVSRAAALQPSAALRDEAIAALALPDVQFVPVWTNPSLAFLLFSPTLRHFAAPGVNGEIRLVNAEDAREESRLPAVGAAVERVCFSADEHFLAARYWNRSNLVWDLASRIPVRGWGLDQVFVEFCPDSERVLVEESGFLKCLSLASGREIWRCQSGSSVTKLSMAEKGSYLALFVGTGPTVQVRSLLTGELVRELPSTFHLGTLAWSSDGRKLVVGRDNGRVEVWEADTWTQIFSWEAHDDAVVEARFDPAGRWLATASWDMAIRFWSLPDFRPAMAAKGYGGHFVAQFSPDGGRFACMHGANVLGFLEVAPSPVLRRLFVPPGEVRGTWSVDASPDGKLVAAGYSDGLRLLDLVKGNLLAFEPLSDCRSVLFTPDGGALVTCGDSGLARWTISRVPANDGQALRLGPPQQIRAGTGLGYASLASDGRWLAVADRDAQAVEIYELPIPTNHFMLGPHPRIQHVAISPDGHWVASGTWKGRGVKVWELATRRQVADLPVEESATVSFSADGQLLVTGSREYRVWECGSWRERYRSPDTGGVAVPIAFSPDGHLLAFLRAPGVLELREPATGQVLAALQTPGFLFISELRFTADSTKLLALESTRQIYIWDLTRTHAELAKLGLDWAEQLLQQTQNAAGTKEPEVRAEAGGRLNQPIQAANLGRGLLGSRTDAVFYTLTLVALALGVAIGLHTVRYHQRMMRSYEEIESVAAERNRALATAQAELLHSQKMRALGTLAAGIAHDFNNLLSIIRMGNDLLGRPDIPKEEKTESNLAVERAVDQGKKIVRSMLGYSRGQAEEAESYSVADLVNETGLLLNQQFLRGITLTLELNRDLPLATGHRGKLQQILLNLMVNATEAMNGQGRLRIAAHLADSTRGRVILQPGLAARYLELIIEDTGPGIDPLIRDRIFEPFFSTKPRGASSGTGLGLSLVHSMAEQEKMGIGLESAAGHGTTFTIWIPVGGVPSEPPHEVAVAGGN